MRNEDVKETNEGAVIRNEEEMNKTYYEQRQNEFLDRITLKVRNSSLASIFEKTTGTHVETVEEQAKRIKKIKGEERE